MPYRDEPLTTTLVDSHVHLYDCFSPEGFLEAATANLTTAAAQLHMRSPPPLFLLLAESAGYDAFAGLADRSLPTGAWAVRRLAEPESLLVSRTGRPPVWVVSGRQVATSEDLEVLALGTRAVIEDGMPLRHVVEIAQTIGAVVVIPWGFGKWTLRRARLIREVLHELEGSGVHVGDLGGRPIGSRRPALFKLAESLGWKVLPGSGPLPFRSDVHKVGRYGFVARLLMDPERPLAAFRRWLALQTVSPPAYGTLERLPVFVHRQVGMQIKKLIGRRRRSTSRSGTLLNHPARG